MNFRILYFYFALTAVLIAQNSSAEYYPLAVGNKWEYQVLQYSIGPIPDTSYYTKEVIGKKLMTNGIEYFEIKDQYRTVYERFDSLTNKIHAYEATGLYDCGGYDVAIYDLNYSKDSTYEWKLCDSIKYFNNYEASNPITGLETIRINWDFLVVGEVTFQKGLGNYSIRILEGGLYYATVVKAIISGDTTVVTNVENESINTNLNDFQLAQNYPNPFNPTTTIKFTIPVGTDPDLSLQTASLLVYDILGRQVATLINEPLRAGAHKVEFDATDLASGIYYYQLSTNNQQLTKKMLLLK
jgi:hypothetical protein